MLSNLNCGNCHPFSRNQRTRYVEYGSCLTSCEYSISRNPAIVAIYIGYAFSFTASENASISSFEPV